MPKITLLNKISKAGLRVLTGDYQITEDIKEADLVLVRSQAMHDIALSSQTLAVARAGAGVNNIPLEAYAKQGVVVFNTPGANANAVKELTLLGLLLSMRDVLGGIHYLKTHQDDLAIDKTVEKVKSAYGGNEIKGKTIGIIGLGTIGMMVAKAASDLGMNVIGTKRNLATINQSSLDFDLKLVLTPEEVYQQADVISLNLPMNDKTKHMISQQAFEHMRDGVIILNFARAGLVDDDALEGALNKGKVRRYVTDFPNHKTNNLEGVIAIPHLGASTEESEDNCATMAAEQVMRYLETGSIKHAVTYPDMCGDAFEEVARIVILVHERRHLDLVVKDLSNLVPEAKIRFAQNDAYAVIHVDLNQLPDPDALEPIKAIEGVARVRILTF
ncbi:MAG: NAD(P)-binding domain-containing protein [Acholeplasmataceae bacterium]|nr:NAD(P)-binding domain-containing protein [Acholeplasmataceae bacterium]